MRFGEGEEGIRINTVSVNGKEGMDMRDICGNYKIWQLAGYGEGDGKRMMEHIKRDIILQ